MLCLQSNYCGFDKHKSDNNTQTHSNRFKWNMVITKIRNYFFKANIKGLFLYDDKKAKEKFHSK